MRKNFLKMLEDTNAQVVLEDLGFWTYNDGVEIAWHRKDSHATVTLWKIPKYALPKTPKRLPEEKRWWWMYAPSGNCGLDKLKYFNSLGELVDYLGKMENDSDC